LDIASELAPLPQRKILGAPVVPNINFHENPSSWNAVVACEQTDGHDGAKNDVLQLRGRV
jgi:hypothetical protein